MFQPVSSFRSIAVPLLLCLPSVAAAQQQQPENPLDMGNLELLMDPRICKEIEVIGEQQDQIRAALKEIFRVFRDRDLPTDVQAAKLKEMREAVNKSLLPHQHERLNQLRLHAEIERAGTAGALYGQLGRDLGLSEQQRAEIRRVHAEQTAELAEKVQRLREESRAKLHAILTREQRRQLESLLGDPYDNGRTSLRY